ncbi:MAG: hypothetical protein ACK40M_06320 [Flavobacteriales bacterium]
MKYEKQIVKIPIEIFLETCQMIYTGNLYNKILGSNETMGEVIMELGTIKGNPYQKDAMTNVLESVKEWNEYRHGVDDPDEISLH